MTASARQKSHWRLSRIAAVFQAALGGLATGCSILTGSSEIRGAPSAFASLAHRFFDDQEQPSLHLQQPPFELALDFHFDEQQPLSPEAFALLSQLLVEHSLLQ